MKQGHLILEIEPASIAEELEIEKGDRLLEIDGNEIQDIFDYQYYCNQESLVMLVEKSNGELWELEIEHDYEDLGLVFDQGIMSDYQTCTNQCIFCFVDQMPKGMRDTLYFKDDDSRLSFLQGNYITLTNLKDKDIQRIIKMGLSPINISVHTTNPQLRCEMLHNRFAGESLKHIDALYQAETMMNGQVVLCKGINDGEELENTINDLSRYLPYMESLSIVPVGISKYREGLYPLELFTEEDACKVIDLIEAFQKKCYKEQGLHFVHASDEFYLLAKREIPNESSYDGYLQLENGVGMIRLLCDEIETTLEECRDIEVQKHRKISIATGALAYDTIKRMAERVKKQFPHISVQVYEIRNEFFGPTITVAGLITGQDIMEQLKGKDLGECLLLPECMLRSGETVFLDDKTVSDVQKALQVPINIVKSSGQNFVEALLNRALNLETDYPGYELKEIEHE